MGKLKRVYSYETTDGRVFHAPNAKAKAEKHQSHINGRETASRFVDEAAKIFGFGKDSELSNDDVDNIDALIDRCADYAVFGSEGDNFDNFVDHFITLISIAPGPFMEMVERLKSYPIEHMGKEKMRWDHRKRRLVRRDK